MSTIKTYAEFCDAVHNILPDASLGEDNDGQIIIYTNLVTDGEYLVSSNLFGSCDECNKRYVLGADDHCGECGRCHDCCEWSAAEDDDEVQP